MSLLRLSNDTLLGILCHCNVRDVLRLERTCKALRELTTTRYLWLCHLRTLDRAHAPNLPIHIDPISLGYCELREMVIKAIRTFENLNCREDPFGGNARSTILHLEDPRSNHTEMIRKPHVHTRDYKLVPGGKYIFVLWSHGHLQMVEIKSQQEAWVYPKVPVLRSGPESLWNVEHYAVDFRADGSISVVVCERGLSNDLLVERLEIDTESLKSRMLFSKLIESHIGFDVFSVATQGDYVAIHCDYYSLCFPLPSTLILVDCFSGQTVHSFGGPASTLTFIREHLFITCRAHAKYPPVLWVLDVRRVFPERGARSRKSNKSVGITLEHEKVEMVTPEGFVLGEIGPPSLCSFHWKEEHERYDLITIELYANKSWCGDNRRYSPGLNSYVFSPEKKVEGSSTMKLVSSTGLTPIRFSMDVSAMGTCNHPPTVSGSTVYDLSSLYPHSYSDSDIYLSVLDEDGKQSTHRMESINRLVDCYKHVHISMDHSSGTLLLPRGDKPEITIVYPV